MASTQRRSRLDQICAEFEGVSLGDERLNRRLLNVATLVAAEPAASFPVASGNDANLEATYRFLNNERVQPDEILAPHVRRTVLRAHEVERVVVAHDTTIFNFGPSAREDLGHVGQGKSFGFYGHFSLALRADTGEALGVVHVQTHHRHGDKGRRGHKARQSASDNEGRRWLEAVEASEHLLRPRTAPIHVMDREADSYALLANLASRGIRFVVRMKSPKRKVHGEHETVGEALVHANVLAERKVPITARRRSPMPTIRRLHPERSSRVASLLISAARVTIQQPSSSYVGTPRTLTLHAVRIFEPAPPRGEPAVEWRLWTLEPIDSVDDVLAVIDDCRRRWLIEEYFKALKTGCSFEKRQLESVDALLNALAVFIPVAWRLLLLRTMARDQPQQPASRALTPTQLHCLDFALRKLGRPHLPKRPSTRDAMLGVAGLGGHISNNGDPGWIVLGRGYEKLLTIELGYLAASTM